MSLKWLVNKPITNLLNYPVSFIPFNKQEMISENLPLVTRMPTKLIKVGDIPY